MILHHNGLGLQAVRGKDHCEVTMHFPTNTIPKWKDPKPRELEGISYDSNLYEVVATWEQCGDLLRYAIAPRFSPGNSLMLCPLAGRTMRGKVLTRAFNYTPPYSPKQLGRFAVISNSGDLLKTKFGKNIDGYDAIFRENGAPIENYTEYVGSKSTFQLLNKGSANALDKDAGMEVLIVKTTIHDIMSKMIREVPIHNPVYLMLGASFGSAAKGTGLKALEFALSICDTVNMYGFTVDPAYKEWIRYFLESRQGHIPLHGRAYYQMMKCLGIKIHSPLRTDPNRVVKWVPSCSTISAARIASEKLLGRVF